MERPKRNLEDILLSANIPEAYLEKCFDNFETPTEEHAQFKDAVLKAMGRLFAGTTQGILLSGSCGAGKSHLLVAVLREYILRRDLARAFFINVPQLFFDLKASFDPKSPYSERVILKRLRNTHLLALDDFGEGLKGDYANEVIYSVISHREFGGLPLLISTHHEPEAIIGIYSPAVYDRIMGMCEVIEVDLPSWRRRGEWSDESG